MLGLAHYNGRIESPFVGIPPGRGTHTPKGARVDIFPPGRQAGTTKGAGIYTYYMRNVLASKIL